jgi:hypothetical protein
MHLIIQNCSPSATNLRRKSRLHWHPALLAGGLVLLCAALSSGCRSAGKPASASFASVVIAGRSVEEIQQAAVAVFQGDGYRAPRAAGGDMIFEKEGSRKNQIAYAGPVGAHYGEQVIVRVRAQIVELGASSDRLQCKAYMVRNANDSFFADEIPLPNRRGRPYQKLLDEVARRLK